MADTIVPLTEVQAGPSDARSEFTVVEFGKNDITDDQPSGLRLLTIGNNQRLLFEARFSVAFTPKNAAGNVKDLEWGVLSGGSLRAGPRPYSPYGGGVATIKFKEFRKNTTFTDSLSLGTLLYVGGASISLLLGTSTKNQIQTLDVRLSYRFTQLDALLPQP